MRKGWAKKLLLYALLLFLIGWPVKQIAGMLGAKSEKHDAALLLYQVSLFQMELLNSCMHEAARAQDTKELDALKQSLYTAGYTHERLVLAVGGDKKLTALNSLPQLMQYVQRLQIGGERGMKAGETQTFQEASVKFQELYEAYEELMSAKANVIASRNEEVERIDAEATEWIRKKLLE